MVESIILRKLRRIGRQRLFGRFTLLDLTIAVCVFILISVLFSYFTILPVWEVLLIAVSADAVLIFARVKTARVRILQQAAKKAEEAQRLLDILQEQVQKDGDVEDLKRFDELKKQLDRASDFIEAGIDIAYKEDILGYKKIFNTDNDED